MALPVISDIERDAAIQRFEYSFETFWKAARHYLLTAEGLQAGSPKQVMRGLHQVGILSEDETVEALNMVDDRNLTVHTYDEGKALEIFERIRKYSLLMRDVLGRLEVKS